MSTPAITYTGPTIDPNVPFEIRRHLQLLYQKLGNHTQAFALQQKKIDSIGTGTSTTIVEGSSGGGSTPSTPTGIQVNNQSGVTSYATVSEDDGVLLILSDSSPISVSLTSQSPPWGCYIMNQGAFGAGIAALTPSSGSISYTGNPSASSLPLLPGYGCIVAFDGSDWWALTTPLNSVFPFTSIMATYTIQSTDYQIECTSNSFTVTLPSAVGIKGTVYSIKNTGTGTITVATTSSETIDGELTQPISQWTNMVVISNGAGWLIQ